MTETCSCSRLRVGMDVTSHRNLDPNCQVHGVGTDYWNGPARAQRGRAVEWQRRAARAKRIAADPDAASDSEKLLHVADLLDLLQDKEGIEDGRQVQAFLRDLSRRIET